MFKPVPSAPDFPALEQDVLKRWRAAGIPEKAQAREKKGKGPFVFYEGPPTANGRPGIHHVSARVVKDAFCRFKTMQGHRVERRAGWDTHGLPVELEIEKEIGSTGKSDIEAYGVAAFNDKCRESVFRYIGDWVKLTERIGFWLDFDDAYVTYKRDYIETEWAILKNFFDRDLLYQDYKTTMHCTRCNTSLADHEVSQGMEEAVDDPSIYVKFPADRDVAVERGLIRAGETRKLNLLIWTTTPWTIPSNVAIAISGDARYAVVSARPFAGASEEEAEQLFVVAEPLLGDVFEEGSYAVEKTVEPKELEGLSYAPVLDGKLVEGAPEDLHRVVIDEIVEIGSGTGLVHVAPAYGDLELGQRHSLPVMMSIGRDGKVLDEVRAPGEAAPGPLSGTFFKEADRQLTRMMKRLGCIYLADRIKHAYPFCWRDGTPLIHLAKTSWYIRTTAVKDALIANNQKINWKPEHVRDGRFGRWLEGNVDWAISRERFWGCPLPIWTSEDGEAICIGSVKELEEMSGRDLSDLDPHRPHIDAIEFEKDGKKFTRVPDTIDVWFDSGAMPYAQQHWPFESAERFADQFPGDFISEAIDQTRGWFYSLHAISTLLTYPGDEATPAGPLAGEFGATPAFRNVVVQGFVNDENDRKMSKSRGNTVDPWSVLDKEGCDPLRWYIASNAAPGKNIAFNRADIAKQSIKLFLTLWNVYGFFVTYANLSKPDLDVAPALAERPRFDRWLEARRNQLVRDVTTAFEDYDLPAAADMLARFIDRDLSNWYVRLNRRRFWKGEDADAASAFKAVHDSLLTLAKLTAPLAPFLSEVLYENLVGADAADSVHLSDWPVADESAIDVGLTEDMAFAIEVVRLGRSARAGANIRTRQPLRSVYVRVRDAAEKRRFEEFAEVVLEELNVQSHAFMSDEDVQSFAEFTVRPNFATLGVRLGAKLKALRQALGDEVIRQGVVDALLKGDPVSLNLDGEATAFEPEDFLLDYVDKGGFALAMDSGRVVALETDLDEALIEEGRVREMLRLLQDMRRRAGLEVNDRIVLGLGGADAERLVEAHAERLGEELLAVDVQPGLVDAPMISETLDVEGLDVAASIRRADASDPTGTIRQTRTGSRSGADNRGGRYNGDEA